jgi:hypothetical protein
MPLNGRPIRGFSKMVDLRWELQSLTASIFIFSRLFDRGEQPIPTTFRRKVSVVNLIAYCNRGVG